MSAADDWPEQPCGGHHPNATTCFDCEDLGARPRRFRLPDPRGRAVVGVDVGAGDRSAVVVMHGGHVMRGPALDFDPDRPAGDYAAMMHALIRRLGLEHLYGKPPTNPTTKEHRMDRHAIT